MIQITCAICEKVLGWIYHPITQKDIDEGYHKEKPDYEYFCVEHTQEEKDEHIWPTLPQDDKNA